MSSLVTRAIKIGGKRTSVRLTPVEAEALTQICKSKRLSTSKFCVLADERFNYCSVRTQRIRMAILKHYMQENPSSLGDPRH